jgi:hypothetical protein
LRSRPSRNSTVRQGNRVKKFVTKH